MRSLQKRYTQYHLRMEYASYTFVIIYTVYIYIYTYTYIHKLRYEKSVWWIIFKSLCITITKGFFLFSFTNLHSSILKLLLDIVGFLIRSSSVSLTLLLISSLMVVLLVIMATLLQLLLLLLVLCVIINISFILNGLVGGCVIRFMVVLLYCSWYHSVSLRYYYY